MLSGKLTWRSAANVVEANIVTAEQDITFRHHQDTNCKELKNIPDDQKTFTSVECTTPELLAVASDPAHLIWKKPLVHLHTGQQPASNRTLSLVAQLLGKNSQNNGANGPTILHWSSCSMRANKPSALQLRDLWHQFAKKFRVRSEHPLCQTLSSTERKIAAGSCCQIDQVEISSDGARLMLQVAFTCAKNERHAFDYLRFLLTEPSDTIIARRLSNHSIEFKLLIADQYNPTNPSLTRDLFFFGQAAAAAKNVIVHDKLKKVG